MNVLVVGGAGYIGSHCVRQLVAAGHRPVVLDSLVYGHRAAVAPEVPFHSCNLGDEAALWAASRDLGSFLFGLRGRGVRMQNPRRRPGCLLLKYGETIC